MNEFVDPLKIKKKLLRFLVQKTLDVPDISNFTFLKLVVSAKLVCTHSAYSPSEIEP